MSQFLCFIKNIFIQFFLFGQVVLTGVLCQQFQCMKSMVDNIKSIILLRLKDYFDLMKRFQKMFQNLPTDRKKIESFN